MAEHAEHEPKYLILIWSIVIIGVLVVAAIMIYSATKPAPNPNLVTYKNYDFTRMEDGFWQFRWQSGTITYHIPLRYNPLQMENVTINGVLGDNFGEDGVTITVDPSDGADQQYVALAAAEIGINLVKVFSADMKAACTENRTDSCAIRPIVKCGDNSSVIYLREASGPSVTFEGRCITLSGEGLELVQAVDRLLFMFYGIMPPQDKV